MQANPAPREIAAMLRAALSALAVATALTLLSVAPSTAIAQTAAAPVEFNQTLLDRRLIAIPAINRLSKSGNAPQTEEAAQSHIKRICKESGFETYDQCTSTIGYVGMLVGGFDPATKTFQNPIEKMRARIAEIEGNTKLSAAAKEQMTAPMKEVVAGFPHTIPTAHLQLMTANGMHIFKTLAAQAKK
jgi:hypothetical protein